MKESASSSIVSPRQTVQAADETNAKMSAKISQNGASFDTTPSLSGLKRLQDAGMFEKARFRFRLYRK